LKRFVKIVALGVALVALVVLWNVFQAARTALDAEWTFQAFLCVLELTDQYQESHQGEWPPDWQALKQIPYDREGMWKWPEDSAEIQQRITIDFNVEPEDVAAMSADEFRAIRQREPCFPTSADWRVQALINDNRERLGMPTK
jgi:recombinational DNA repair protein RecT